MSSEYSHTQPGTLTRIVILFVLLWFSVLHVTIAYSEGFENDSLRGIQFASLMLAIILYLFWDLTIQIKDGTLIHWFGPGFWKKTHSLDSIKEATASKSQWWNGYGIRFVGDGWMYNVSGKDRIRIEFNSGKICYLGTDDLDELLNQINQHLNDD